MLETILDLIRKNEAAKMLTFNTYKLIRKAFNIAPRLPVDFQKEEANELIKKYLESDKPCMICRFGENELRTAVAYLNEQNKIKPNIRGILRMESFSLNEPRVINWMRNGAGFFPSTSQTLEKFAILYLKEMQFADILGAWLAKETRIKAYLDKDCNSIPLVDLEPWSYSQPWTTLLKNKKVLVIHPFENSIKSQYKKREKIFSNADVLPEFELKTLKAVQSAAGEKTGFKDWFEALDYMCNEIDEVDFDIALIAAGAYGLPLAAFVKKTGKKAVHLGGNLQLLFGIKGKRWDDTNFAENFYNKYWTKATEAEKPKNAEVIEGATYW